MPYAPYACQAAGASIIGGVPRRGLPKGTMYITMEPQAAAGPQWAPK